MSEPQPSITARQLIAEARKLIGTPWHHQGRNRYGVDCVGMVLLAFRNAGIDYAALVGIEDTARYGRRPPIDIERALPRYCAERIAQPIPGALIFFQWEPENLPRHQGIATERGTFVHANATGVAKRVVETPWRDPWRRRTHSVWKLHGVAYD